MSLYAYAIANRAPTGLKGLQGEPLSGIDLGGAFVVVSELNGAPELEVSALRGHDEVVRRLADEVDAVLPARFGSIVADEDELRALLSPRVEALRDALSLVTGCIQMTLRVFMDRPRRKPTAATGTEYLAQRMAALRLPELDPVRAQVTTLIRAERIETHATPPLVATVHHLVHRENLEAYLEAVKRAETGDVRLVTGGPAPPYAFTPESVK